MGDAPGHRTVAHLQAESDEQTGTWRWAELLQLHWGGEGRCDYRNRRVRNRLNLATCLRLSISCKSAETS